MATYRVDEVATSESTGDERRAGSSGTLNDAGITDMAEDVAVAEATKRELAPVGVGGEVLDGVEEGSEEAVGFVEVVLGSTVTSTTAGVDALVDALANETSRSIPGAVLVGDVVLYEIRAIGGDLRARKQGN